MYNIDKTSFSLDTSKTKVVGEKNSPSTRDTSGSGRESTSVLMGGNTSADKLPPLIVFIGKNEHSNIKFQDIAALASTFKLAPPAPLLEDFVYHWRMITKFYVNKDTTTRVVVESTNIPAHLDQLIKVR
ncbi:unnamed protein product, partial [Timema podura]|nr:unnamed protein product [Timema podura]